MRRIITIAATAVLVPLAFAAAALAGPKASTGCDTTPGCGSQQIVPGNGNVLDLAVNNAHNAVEAKIALSGTSNNTEDWTVTALADGNYAITWTPYGIEQSPLKCLTVQLGVLHSVATVAPCIGGSLAGAGPGQQWDKLPVGTGYEWVAAGAKTLALTDHLGQPYSQFDMRSSSYQDANQIFRTAS